MAQVPYNGAPSVAPEDQPIPYRQTSTPLAAFGGDTAAAISHLGDVSQKAGDELFARGYAMQELNQQAAANEAVAKHTMDMGQKFADYTSLEGKAAVDGYQPFLDSMAKSRDQFREDLDSPYAQRLYDQETRNQQGRLTFSAARHAGDQNKQYVIGSGKARIEAAGQELAAHPEDEQITAANIQVLRDQASHLADISGVSPEAKDQLIKNTVSDKLAAQIQSLAKTKPALAQKMLKQYGDSGDMTPDDATKVSGFVQNQLLNVGARGIASDVMSGAGNKWGEGIVDIKRAGQAIKDIESSGGNYTITNVKTGALGAYQVMPSSLQGFLREAGMDPMTPQEFLNNKAAQDQLFETTFSQYMKDGHTANAAATKWFTGTFNPREGANDGKTTAPEYLTKFNATLAKNAPLAESVDRARASAREVDPDNKLLGDSAASHVEMLHAQQERVRKDDEFNTMQTINGSLFEAGPGGKLPTTMEELKADPKVEAALDAVTASDPKKLGAIRKQLLDNTKTPSVPTDKQLSRYRDLTGMQINEPDKFLDLDIVNEDLPQGTKMALIKDQARIYKNADADPKVSHALSVLSQQLNGAGLTRESDKDGLNQFTGSLHDAIQIFQDNNKRPPKDDEIIKMGSQLLQKHDAGWFSGGTPTFQQEVPKEARDIIVKQAADMGYPEPTDQEIQRAYAREVFKQTYAKKVNGPEAPRR